ncbi:MAG: hypothetical protein VYC34_08460 [Planctomycetota bacterium]|nr:hypothetical protein [Planctomycetota bacterium]
MAPASRELWAEHLRSLCARSDAAHLPHTGEPEGFRVWRLGAPMTAGARPDRVDDVLWRAVVDPEVGIEQLEETLAVHDGPGPLRTLAPGQAIEVWTERELCGLHALLWLAHQREQARWRAIAEQVGLWHIQNTQPDNATNRPWAIHLFIALAEHDGGAESRLYAETLLHNCRVANGRPDPLSAQILLDAADALEQT